MRQAASSLVDFQGAGRRFERVGHVNGAEVVDDYAHHPTEVAATLAAARTLEPRRVIAVFQPHLYSRTQREARHFGEALARADLALILDVYPARERPEDYPGITGLLVAEATADAGNGKRVVWMPDRDAAKRFLQAEIHRGDLLLTLGAGDVNALGQELVAGT
jgi:UDP-N-acetylmuramate--alanine ligase